MSRGFVILGIDTDSDQIQYGYALALSIKICDPTAEVCLVVDKDKEDLVPKQYFHAFDYITELPFGNTGHDDGFHGSNVWQLIHCTPFDETIYLDYDTLFLNVDVDLLWEQFENYSIAMPALARTYRNTFVNKSTLFDIEANYQLPALYNQLIYFTNDDTALEWFKMADPVFQNWREVYNNTFNEIKPQSFDKNIICNLVTGFLDMSRDCSIVLNNFYDLHTRSQDLWNNEQSENWSEVLNSWYSDSNGLLIENSLIRSGIVHYRDEQFLTKEIINDLRNSFDTATTRTQDI